MLYFQCVVLNCTLSCLKLSDRFVIVAKCKIIFWFATMFAYKVWCALLQKQVFQNYLLSLPHYKPVIERLTKFSLGNQSIDGTMC